MHAVTTMQLLSQLGYLLGFLPFFTSLYRPFRYGQHPLQVSPEFCRMQHRLPQTHPRPETTALLGRGRIPRNGLEAFYALRPDPMIISSRDIVELAGGILSVAATSLTIPQLMILCSVVWLGGSDRIHRSIVIS